MKFSIKYLMLSLSIMVNFSNYCNNANAIDQEKQNEFFNNFDKYDVTNIALDNFISQDKINIFVHSFVKSIDNVNVQDWNQTIRIIASQEYDDYGYQNWVKSNPNQNNQSKYMYFLRQVYSVLFLPSIYITNNQFQNFINRINESELTEKQKQKVYKWLLYCSCNASTLVDTNRTKHINKARHNILLNRCIYINDQNIDHRINRLSSYIANLLLSSHNIQINNNANNDEKHNLIQQTIRNVIGDYGTFNASTTKNITNKKTLNYTIVNNLLKDLIKLTINKFPEKETEIRNSNNNAVIANAIFYMMRYIPASIEDSMYCNLCNTHNVNIDKNSIVDKNRIIELYNNTNSGFMRAFSIMQKFMDEFNLGGYKLKNIIRIKLLNKFHKNGSNGTELSKICSNYILRRVLDNISQ